MDIHLSALPRTPSDAEVYRGSDTLDRVRIASLVPAGTEIVCALGAGDRLVAVTHDCDHPDFVRGLPRLTGTTIPEGASSGDIDGLVRSAGERGESTFHLDGDALRAARPDVIIGQTICRVCAVTFEQLPARLPTPPRVVPLEATSLEGVFADIHRVGVALGLRERAEDLAAGLRARIAAVGRAVDGVPRPRVVCLEWTDPLFQGGHWVPEQVHAAGGTDLLGIAGERSRELAWEEIVTADPDVLVVMPCGFGVERAFAESRTLATRPGWESLTAVRSGRVYAADGSAYFSRPGPRVVDGIEILAGLLHPSRVPAPAASAATRVPLEPLSARDAVLATARETVAVEAALAAAVCERRPGAWGRLAGLAVIAHRERLGRRLEDPERRAVWDAVWREAHGIADPPHHRPIPS